MHTQRKPQSVNQCLCRTFVVSPRHSLNKSVLKIGLSFSTFTRTTYAAESRPLAEFAAEEFAVEAVGKFAYEEDFGGAFVTGEFT
jgi:hypothetical protein